jgi:hypothetical protein
MILGRISLVIARSASDEAIQDLPSLRDQCKLKEREVVCRELVIPGGDSPTMLDVVEENARSNCA